MSTETWIAIVGVILGSGGLSALGGYLLAGRNERKKDERAAGRDRDALRERQADEGRVFQRDTLLEIHDLLYKMNRNSGRSQHIDEMRYRETGKYGRGQLPDDLSDEFSELVGGINRLRVRVFDRDVRDLIDRYTKTVISSSISGGQRREGDDAEVQARAKRIQMQILDQWGPLEEALGALIRSQFPGSDLAPLDGRLAFTGAHH
jgi:hypothetical protein